VIYFLYIFRNVRKKYAFRGLWGVSDFLYVFSDYALIQVIIKYDTILEMEESSCFHCHTVLNDAEKRCSMCMHTVCDPCSCFDQNLKENLCFSCFDINNKHNIEMTKRIRDKIDSCKSTDRKYKGTAGNISVEYIYYLLVSQRMRCYVCKQQVLYNDWEPYCMSQFAVTRIDETKPCNMDNVLIACMFCNINKIGSDVKLNACKRWCHNYASRVRLPITVEEKQQLANNYTAGFVSDRRPIKRVKPKKDEQPKRDDKPKRKKMPKYAMVPVGVKNQIKQLLRSKEKIDLRPTHINAVLKSQNNKCLGCGDEMVLGECNLNCYYRGVLCKINNTKQYEDYNIYFACLYCEPCDHFAPKEKRCKNKIACHKNITKPCVPKETLLENAITMVSKFKR